MLLFFATKVGRSLIQILELLLPHAKDSLILFLTHTDERSAQDDLYSRTELLPLPLLLLLRWWRRDSSTLPPPTHKTTSRLRVATAPPLGKPVFELATSRFIHSFGSGVVGRSSSHVCKYSIGFVEQPQRRVSNRHKTVQRGRFVTAVPVRLASLS